MDYADGGVMATAGEQNEIADRFHGSGKQMGNIEQSTMTANAARAAATSAERFSTGNGETMPIASYKGAEAAAAMNGVTAFGNDHLQGFNYATGEDGLSYISTMARLSPSTAWRAVSPPVSTPMQMATPPHSAWCMTMP